MKISNLVFLVTVSLLLLYNCNTKKTEVITEKDFIGKMFELENHTSSGPYDAQPFLTFHSLERASLLYGGDIVEDCSFKIFDNSVFVTTRPGGREYIFEIINTKKLSDINNRYWVVKN